MRWKSWIHTRGVGLAVLEDRVREALVHLDVALPRLRRDPQPVREVVEERPERVVADAVVEVLLLAAGEQHRIQVVARESLRDALLERGRHDRSGPADPGRVPAHGLQRRREAARAALDLDVVAGDRQPDRQAVAGDDETVVSRMSCQRSSFRSKVGRRYASAKDAET